MRRFILLLITGFLLSSAAFASAQWLSQTSPVTYQLNDVHAINETTAVAVGAYNTILKTTDRGVTWQTKTIAAAGSTIRAVHFPSDSYGYAVGSLIGILSYEFIYQTTDEGNTWQTKSTALAASPRDVFFVSTSEGFYTNQRTLALGGGCFKSTDGGSNWNQSGTGLANATYYGIHFNDPLNGWICGSGGNIYKTSNGGAEWLPQTSGTTVDLQDIFFLDSNYGWAVGSNETLRTTNGGSNWSKQTHATSFSLYAVRFVDALNGWAVGKNNSAGIILITTDGGVSWTPDSGFFVYPLYGADFSDEYNGWAVGGSSSFISKYVRNPNVSSCVQQGTSISQAPQGWTGNVTVTGPSDANFQNGCNVAFSGTGMSVNSVTFDSSTQLTVNISIESNATKSARNVTVTNPDSGVGTLTNGFTVTANPQITSLDPASGTQGDTITGFQINGTGFQTGATLSISGPVDISDSNLSVNSPFEITADLVIDSDASTEVRNIQVTNPDTGVSNLYSFTVKSSTAVNPTITGITPTTVATGETNKDIDVTGTDFKSGIIVSIENGITINSTTYNSPTSITINIDVDSDAATGTRVINIQNTDGGAGSSADNNVYLYVTDVGVINPSIISVSPNEVFRGTSKGLYIKVENLQDGATVSFNPISGITIIDISYTIDDPIYGDAINVEIDADANALLGLRGITIINPDGGNVTKDDAWGIIDQTAKVTVSGKRGLAFPNPWNAQKDPILTLQCYLTKGDSIIFRGYNIDGHKVYESDLIDAPAGNFKHTIDRNDFLDQDFLGNGIKLFLVYSKSEESIIAKIKVMVENQ